MSDINGINQILLISEKTGTAVSLLFLIGTDDENNYETAVQISSYDLLTWNIKESQS